MRILYLFRNPAMGYSIGKVFAPVVNAMKKHADVDVFYMPAFGYSLRSLCRNILAVRKIVSSNKYDVIHITGQENYLIPFLPKNHLVVTVHDLGFAKHAYGISGKVKHSLFVDTLSLVPYLTCVSEKTKREVLSSCGIEEKKIRVINNCVNPDIKYRSKIINTDNPRILQIGLKDNKNVERSLKALRGIKCRFRIIAPKKDFDKSLFENCGIDYNLVSDLTDAEIIEEYAQCDIVNLPSLYEGFGMPIIEGQATGRVVVTSNISPMKEVAGAGAVLVDPNDVDSMHKGYVEAVTNCEFYIQRGLENVRRFDISTVAKQYLDLYLDIGKSNHSKE